MNRELTKDEMSLLLYCEERAVNNNGVLDNQQIDNDDTDILKKWDIEGFVSCKKLCVKTLLINLSEEAWAVAGKLRKEYAEKYRVIIADDTGERIMKKEGREDG